MTEQRPWGIDEIVEPSDRNDEFKQAVRQWRKAWWAGTDTVLGVGDHPGAHADDLLSMAVGVMPQPLSTLCRPVGCPECPRQSVDSRWCFQHDIGFGFRNH